MRCPVRTKAGEEEDTKEMEPPGLQPTAPVIHIRVDSPLAVSELLEGRTLFPIVLSAVPCV